jgi:glycosyltransferase involved in cell wall biosynthesis
VASFFSKYFADLSWCADHIVCISERSRSDYLEFISRAGCKAPMTSVVRLGSRMENSADTSPVSREIATLAKQKYLLFVSTIERRKNHEVLYRAYTRLVDAGIANLPLLIFVGMRGWGVSDLLSDISLDPRTKPHIRILESVSDAELTILYQNAFFTLFPSLYEGWGLPVAEALALGKYCLASNQGAIPEIAGDLLDYIDPWNVSDWTAAILELIGTPSRLQAKEKEIRDRFRPDDWKTCVKQIIDAANGTLNLAAATTN